MADRIQTLLDRGAPAAAGHLARAAVAAGAPQLRHRTGAAQPTIAMPRWRVSVRRSRGSPAWSARCSRSRAPRATHRCAATQPVSLDALLGEVVDDCRIEADARHCRVRLDAAEAIDARGDPELLRRAVENVLRNAIRHAPEAVGNRSRTAARHFDGGDFGARSRSGGAAGFVARHISAVRPCGCRPR